MFFWEYWGKDGIEGFVLLRGPRAPLPTRVPAQGTARRGAGTAALLRPHGLGGCVQDRLQKCPALPAAWASSTLSGKECKI